MLQSLKGNINLKMRTLISVTFFLFRDSDDSMNLLDLVQDEESDHEEDFCKTRDPQRSLEALQQLEAVPEDRASSQLPSTSTSDKEPTVFHVNQFVVVNYEGTMYPGIISEKSSDRFKVSVMEKTSKHWRWPTKPDEIWYSKEEVLYPIQPPRLMKRGIFHVPNMD